MSANSSSVSAEYLTYLSSQHTPPPTYTQTPALSTPPPTYCTRVKNTLNDFIAFFYIFYRCSIYLLASMLLLLLLLLIFYEHCSQLGRFMSPTALGQLPSTPFPSPFQVLLLKSCLNSIKLFARQMASRFCCCSLCCCCCFCCFVVALLLLQSLSRCRYVLVGRQRVLRF